MPVIVTWKQIRDCIQAHNLGELPHLLKGLKNFPVQEWHACIQTLLELDNTGEAEKAEAVRLLLNWGNEESWFHLLEQSTRHVGEDERFSQEQWMTAVPGHSQENEKTDAHKRDICQDPCLDLLMKRDLWPENTGYRVAIALLKEHPQLSVTILRDKRNIFRHAAQKNASPIIILAIEVAKEHGFDYKRVMNTQDGTNRNSMGWAVREGHDVAVRVLFEVFPEIQVTKDVLLWAITQFQTDITRILAKHRPKLIDMATIFTAIDVNHLEVWEYLLDQMIHATGYEGIEIDKFMEKTNILHHAVANRQLDIVKILVERYPSLTVQIDEKKHSVLWYNRSREGQSRTETQDKIREIILPEVMRLKSVPQDIRKILRDDGKEIALDLRPVKYSPRSLQRFLEKISNNTKYPNIIPETHSVIAELEFESTLRYIDIHISDTNRGDSGRPKESGSRDEVLSILNWLSKDKGVKKIIEIRVSDSHYQPHSEEIIGLAIRRFDVEILDWKRTDLSIDAVLDAAPNVKNLHLYSSGNWAPLAHWVGADGVARLKKDNISKTRAKEYMGRLTTILAELKALKLKDDCKWNFRIHQSTFEIKSPPPVLPKPDVEKLVSPPRALRIEEFLDGYQHLQEDISNSPQNFPGLSADLSPRIKVAVIDTGVDETLLDDTFSGTLGASFVSDEGNESSWWFAQELHGTYMVKIIHALDPYCDLKIYQVAEARDDILPERVATAIRSAIDEGVDIISMSFCFEEDSPGLSDLKEQVSEALGYDIVLLASTADEGNNAKGGWPAQCEGVIGIVACTPHGTYTEKATRPHDEETFGLQGLGIELKTGEGGPEDVTPGVSGSSVATAMAAGIASLILAYGHTSKFALHRRDTVKAVMKRMAEGSETKYVKPWTVLNPVSGESEHVLRAITQMFKDFEMK